jgi:hypothetical protein
MAVAKPLVSISTVVWQKKTAEYAKFVGKNALEGLNEESPLLFRKIMDFTPPFKTKGRPGASDLSVGRAAVAFDIYKTMRPFNPEEIRSKSLRKIVETKDIAGFNAFAANSKSPLLKGATAIAFSPREHLRQRDTRGRVNGRSRNRVVLGSDVALLKKYVTEMQSRVGYAKSGWWPALRATGGKAPSYVTKFSSPPGVVVDERSDKDNPSITAINRSPWAVRQDEGERILADAKASRINAIISKIRTKERLARKQAKLAA